jgi:hypothetical protein
MPLVLCLILVGVLFARKQFTYIEVFPGVYLIEAVMVMLATSVVMRAFVLLPKGRGIPLRLPLALGLLSCICLFLALTKAIYHVTSGGEFGRLQELPILVYPFFWAVLLVWLSQQKNRAVAFINAIFSYTLLLFPLAFVALYTSGLLDALTLLDRPLWPNNNFVFAACLLVSVFHRHRFPAWLIWSSTAAALMGVLIEAQRGTFVCLFLAFLLLMRRATQALQLLAIGLVAIVIVAAFGEDLSYRFEGGVSDLAGFFKSVTATTDDPRYSSTEHRGEMWSHVVANALESPQALALGKPISESIVPEAWRNPHNGYISALGRGGVVAMAFYLLLLADAVAALLHTRERPRQVVVHILYFTSCIDAMTQTVFDSPYSLFLVIVSAALSIHDRAQTPLFPGAAMPRFA